MKDIAKAGDVMVARPGGISIIAGIAAAELVLYMMMPSAHLLAVLFTTLAAFAVGLIDDLRVMGGWYKPVALGIAALPIILFNAFDSDLSFPLFGDVHIPVLYLALIPAMISITGNTINSIDVANGVASGFMTISGFVLTAALVIVQNYEMAIISLPLAVSALAFYRYHRNPSRIFPGDSGALTFGAMYGAVAIAGGVEIVAAVALLPAIVNSFFFLSSMKRIVEHRQIRSRPVEITDDLKLKATPHKDAPVTLVRLIIAGGPMTESQVCREILKLASFAGVLAIATAFMMGIRL